MTLLDAWGPGNSRASSGGETRVIRGTYGPNQPYTKMAARAMQLWKENEKRWNLKLMHQTGVLWMVAAGDDQFERGSLPALREAGIPCQELSLQEMAARWPQINLEACTGVSTNRRADILRLELPARRCLTDFLPRVANTGPWQSHLRNLEAASGTGCHCPTARR